MSFASTHPFAVGKFRITPLSRCHGSEQHTALLSIRSGEGSQKHERVYTYKPECKTQDCAVMYAGAQGWNWLVSPASLA